MRRGGDHVSDLRLVMVGAVAFTLMAGGAASAQTSPPPSPPLSAAGLPVFGPDEPLVLTAHPTDNGGGIFVKRPDGTGGWQLATDILPGVHKRGGWSPDGQEVVLIDESSEYMWIAHLDGSPTTRVPACDTPGCDFPSFSPDGKRIAFSRYENGAAVGPGRGGRIRGRAGHGRGVPGGPPGAASAG